MSISIEKQIRDGIHRLSVTGELDLEAVPAFEEAVCGCESPATSAIVVDLAGVRFVDSCGLWAISATMRWCDRHGYTLRLLPASDHVHALFELTGLSDVLPFVKDGRHGEPVARGEAQLPGAGAPVPALDGVAGLAAGLRVIG
jgi:anti-sigma B factor antagonist